MRTARKTSWITIAFSQDELSEYASSLLSIVEGLDRKKIPAIDSELETLTSLCTKLRTAQLLASGDEHALRSITRERLLSIPDDE